MNFVKITWYDDFSGQEMATLIRDKFDVSVSYFMEDYNFGIRIKQADFNSKILNFIKKKVDIISVLEESKKLATKSLNESSSVNWNDIVDFVNDYDYVYDIQEIKNDYWEVVCDNKKHANEIADIINANFPVIALEFGKINGGYRFYLYSRAITEKKSATKSIIESKKDTLTVENLCTHNARVYDLVEIWDIEGHHMYDSFKIDDAKKSPYKFHEVDLWDWQQDRLVIYIENNAIPF